MEQALSMILSSPETFSQFDPLITQALTDQMGGKSSLAATDFESYWKNVYEKPIQRSLEKTILPALGSRFAGNIQSSRVPQLAYQATEGMFTQAQSDFARAVMENRTLEAQAQEQAYARQLQAAQLGDAWGMRNLSRANAFTASLAPHIGLQREDFLRTQPEANPFISPALNYLGQSHMALYQPQESSMGGLGSLIGMGAGALGGAFFGNPLLGAQLGGGIGGAAGSLF